MGLRFVSHSPRLEVWVARPVKTIHHVTGAEILIHDGYAAIFNRDDVTQADVDWAEEVFVREGLLHGRTLQVDEVTPTPLINRLSVFDTDEMALREGWEGQTLLDARGNEVDKKEYIEQFLLERSKTSGDFRLVEQKAVEAPWPSYLQFNGTLDEFLAKIVDDGYEPSQVLAYERQTRNNPNVVAALERLAAEQGEALRGAQQIPA